MGHSEDNVLSAVVSLLSYDSSQRDWDEETIDMSDDEDEDEEYEHLARFYYQMDEPSAEQCQLANRRYKFSAHMLALEAPLEAIPRSKKSHPKNKILQETGVLLPKAISEPPEGRDSTLNKVIPSSEPTGSLIKRSSRSKRGTLQRDPKVFQNKPWIGHLRTIHEQPLATFSNSDGIIHRVDKRRKHFKTDVSEVSIDFGEERSVNIGPSYTVGFQYTTPAHEIFFESDYGRVCRSVKTVRYERRDVHVYRPFIPVKHRQRFDVILQYDPLLPTSLINQSAHASNLSSLTPHQLAAAREGKIRYVIATSHSWSSIFKNYQCIV